MSTILITGANKGIGKGLVAKFLSRPSTTVIATVRRPASEEAKALLTLPAASNSRVILAKIDLQSDTDAAEAVEKLAKEDGITRLDDVIANAGLYILDQFVPVAKSNPAGFNEHFDVNVTGVVRLYQAVLPVLKKGSRFAVMSSGLATTAGLEPLAQWHAASYAASKAALNHLVRRIHFENPNITTLALYPGFVQTGNGNKAAEAFGAEKAFTTLDESVDGITARFDSATRESASGKWLSYDNEKLDW